MAPPGALEVRFTAASTFLAVHGFMNRNARGAKLLTEVRESPLRAQSPPVFQGAVWLRVAKLAQSDYQYNAVLAFNALNLVGNLDATTVACDAARVPGGILISKPACLAEMNPLILWLAAPLMRAISKAPPGLNLNHDALCAAMKRQGVEVLAVERHAGNGRDVRPFIVARKPVLNAAQEVASSARLSHA